ncbi:acyl carrier protein [Streptomyces coeruleorubidus]|uniref:acyl carrier protein n=1 Tax=Streptomyces coeruleorubidus TaxID=116188 RepID=UPI0033E8B0D4
MSKPITPDSVRTFIEQELVDFGAEPDAISDDISLDALDIDSLAVVELVASVKRRFAVEIPFEDIPRTSTVSAVCELIRSRTAAA